MVKEIEIVTVWLMEKLLGNGYSGFRVTFVSFECTKIVYNLVTYLQNGDKTKIMR